MFTLEMIKVLNSLGIILSAFLSVYFENENKQTNHLVSKSNW